MTLATTEARDEKRTFRDWFAELYEFAVSRGNAWIIDLGNAESYREYFEDGDTVSDAYLMELVHAEDAERMVVQ